MENRILRIGKIAFTVTQYLILLIMGISLVTGIYLLMNYDSGLPAWLNFTTDTITASTGGEGTSEMPPRSLLIYYLIKMEILLGLTLLVVLQIIHIINSVKNKEAFAQINISRFRKIGLIFLLLFLANMLNINKEDLESFSFRLDFDPVYLLCSLLAYIFAEIFAEGHKIYEENKLTI